ncbi:MAG: tetratricopeptide repeat protein [Isosphaeraceae bacterium]|nr:tetratricopeptide repeat protein [Isosphaeraceae bacterium]
MTAALHQFNERMLIQTQRGTHTEFMESLSPSEARAYLEAFDRWLVRENPQATDQDYYWRSMLMSYFFPDPKLEEADLKRAVALDPGNVDIWVSLGHMAAERKQWSEAIEYYEAGIKARPRNFFPWYGRARVYMELRRFEESLRDINIAIEIHPSLAYGYETRGRIYDAMGEMEKAVADLDFAVQCSAARPYTQRFRNELRKKLQRENSHGR